jgi:hypothetical protein
MTDIMVHDVTNPPLAARFFAYSFLAGYEVVTHNNPSFQNMKGILNDYPVIEKTTVKNYDYQLASLLAIVETASRLQPSGKLLKPLKQKFIEAAKEQGMSDEVIQSSDQYAGEIATKIMAYAKADRYRNISDLPRYTPLKEDGRWFPTPPAFIAAVEPYFNTIRPFLLDSCSQFKPSAPAPFNGHKGSAFYALMDSVYQCGISLNADKKNIAAFWDCNPFAMEDQGHLKVGLKKISPGAHWMGIAGIACNKRNLSFDSCIQIHAILAITLTDAFICCWDEKFRSNRIRPETAIRKYIDPQWMPLLQTPPFPEYLSGHSVVSAASAEILSHYFGDQFSYTDNVEEEFGLPARSFTSFRQAAAEAAVSRFYGGIHFMDAIDTGLVQGKKVGGFILEKFFKSSSQVAGLAGNN